METVSVEQQARAAKEHPVLRKLAGAGFVAYGIVYLLLGWLARQLAIGDREGKVSKNGALHQLAEQAWGEALLWAAVVGFGALVLRTALEAAVGHPQLDGGRLWLQRGGDVARLLVYAVLGFSAAKILLGKSSQQDPDSYTSRLMAMPAGPWLVAAVGLAVIGFAVASVFIGVTDRFQEELDLDGTTGKTGAVLTWLGRVGYVSRGVAFGAMGSLFVWAAATHDPNRSGGLDTALSRVLHAPLGPILLAVIAVGFGCYGTFNIFKARHHRD